MGTLIVMRHAKSDWPPGVPDEDRPLSARGRRDAPVAGQWLRDHLPQPPAGAVVSPAERTRQTWDLAGAAFGDAVPVTYDPRIYAASWTTLLEVVRDSDGDTVVLVGHNPGCEELSAQLAGPGSDRAALAAMGVKYPTAGIAVLAVPGSWRDLAAGSAVLRAFAVPRG